MFVTTAITGCKCRKEASDSSASTTMKSPPPSRACEPAAVTRPRGRRDHFRVVRPHCGGYDYCLGAVHIRRQMLEAQPHAERREPLGGGIDGEVRAADLVAEVDQHLGDARHACAADADEMDPP